MTMIFIFGFSIGTSFGFVLSGLMRSNGRDEREARYE